VILSHAENAAGQLSYVVILNILYSTVYNLHDCVESAIILSHAEITPGQLN
jgi:hypothetical protein